jgi:hypothetical protein
MVVYGGETPMAEMPRATKTATRKRPKLRAVFFCACRQAQTVNRLRAATGATLHDAPLLAGRNARTASVPDSFAIGVIGNQIRVVSDGSGRSASLWLLPP